MISLYGVPHEVFSRLLVYQVLMISRGMCYKVLIVRFKAETYLSLDVRLVWGISVYGVPHEVFQQLLVHQVLMVSCVCRLLLLLGHLELLFRIKMLRHKITGRRYVLN